MPRELPSGQLALLFTDLVSSTAILEAVGPDVYAAALAIHRAIVRAATADHGGLEVDTQGDAFFVVFTSVAEAVAGAAEIIWRTEHAAWPPSSHLRPRLGVHVGEPLRVDEGYVGQAVHRASRICQLAQASQLLLSGTAAALIERELAQLGAAAMWGVGAEPWRIVDLGEQMLKGLTQGERIFGLRAHGLPEDFAPLVRADRIETVPSFRSPFIGRDLDRGKVAHLLDTPGLVTLLGPGGIGKTRLAHQVLEDMRGGLQEIVWLDLAPPREATDVAYAFSEAIGLESGMDRDGLPHRIRTRIGTSPALLVLDGCEHLEGTIAPVVDELLAAVDGLRIIATSHSPLRVAGERIWTVRGLSLPDPSAPKARSGHDAVADDVFRHDGIQLFVARARNAAPGFTLTSGNVEAVADLCRLLDGSPLAMELAAASLRILTPGQIAERLAGRLDLLGNPDHRASPRQQSLHAMIEWSYGRLDPAEQQLFDRLTVFAGSWSLLSAEEVCSGHGLDRHAVVQRLMALVDHSLIETVEFEGVQRFRMLNVMHAYGAHRLARGGDEPQWRARHARHYADRAADVGASVAKADPAAAIADIRADHDEFVAAARHMQSHGEGSSALQLVTDLGRYWELSGRWTIGRRLLEGALGATPAVGGSDGIVAKAWTLAGTLARQQGDLVVAENCLETAARLMEATSSTRDQATVLRQLGSVADERGDPVRAVAYFEEALALAEELGDTWSTAAVQNNWGITAYHIGDYESARALLDASSQAFAALGETWATGVTLFNLGNVEFDTSDLEAAAMRYSAALEIGRQLDDPQGIANASAGLGHVARQRGRLGTASHHYAESALNLLALGDEAGIAEWLTYVADVLIDAGQLPPAVEALATAEATRTRLGSAMAPKEEGVAAERQAKIQATLGRVKVSHHQLRGRMRNLDEAVESALTLISDLVDAGDD